jgi:hypothetical protein
MEALVETDEVGISISVKSPANLHPKYQLELVSLNGIQKTKITELEKIKSQIESKQNDIIILNSKISQITADEELLSNEIIEISEKLDTAI